MATTDPDTTGRSPLTVSQAVGLAKSSLEAITVTLVGEVSEVSNKAGYKAVYFTVKDEEAALPCMMWMNRFRQAGVELRPGLLVMLTGRFTLYAAKGRMNFDVFSVQLAGEGDLRARVAALARKLELEGLMRADRKRPLPQLPATVGLVTSPRGAAVHDVLRTLRRRYPLARVLLAGVPVEGAGAPAALVEGLQAVAVAGADVVLLVRGGGSFEDLMPFNDERLARAIAQMPVPVVTGIGHEPDTSIADMVADLRASTPTAAAEAVAPDVAQLRAMLDARESSLGSSLQRGVDAARLHYERLSSRAVFTQPELLLAQQALDLDLAANRLHQAIPGNLSRDRQRIRDARTRLAAYGATMVAPRSAQVQLAASRLHDLSPVAVLARGFALARDEGGGIVRSIEQTPAGSHLDVTVSDGSLHCIVEGMTASSQQAQREEHAL